MVKTAAKLDFQMGTMVKGCKNCIPTAFLRAIICVLGNSGHKICKKRLQMVTIQGRF
jgi:hypothetical protein